MIKRLEVCLAQMKTDDLINFEKMISVDVLRHPDGGPGKGRMDSGEKARGRQTSRKGK